MNISNAILIRIIGLIVALLWIVLLSFTLPVEVASQGSFKWHDFLIATEDRMYPVNVQVLMWVAFFYCLAELTIQWLHLTEEKIQLSLFNLYQNPSHVTVYTEQSETQIHLDENEALKPELLAAIYYAKRKIVPTNSLIGSLFKKINFQFQSTNDVGDVYTILNSAIDLKLHDVDLRYTVIKYLAWLIPTLGFIGTVIGIAVALDKAGALPPGDPQMLAKVIPLLATAFYTTLLALILSAIIMVLLQLIQANDERVINSASSFCIDNIVAKLRPRSE